MTDDTQTFPARKAQIESLPIEEGFFANVNGLQQWITIRGEDPRNPVLMVVGGPGYALSGLAPFFAPWEQFFTLVQWDQPGAGATHALASNPPLGALTLARLIDDAEAVVRLICHRCSIDRIWMMGFSGGSEVALSLASRSPQLFHGYIGCGQVVHWARQDLASYGMLCEEARKASNVDEIVDLEAIGPPPYADSATDAIKSRYAAAMTAAERTAFGALDAETRAALAAPPANASYVPQNLKLEDPRALSFKTYDMLRKDLVAFDAATLGSRYEIPLAFLQGELDAFTVTSEVQEFVNRIEAPRKKVVTIAGGGHNCIFLRERVLAALREHVLRDPDSSRGGVA